MLKIKIPQEQCSVCLRKARVGNNRPNSLHATKRLFKINLISTKDAKTGRRTKVCARCVRSQLKKDS